MTDDTGVYCEPAEGAFTGMRRRTQKDKQLRLYNDETEEQLRDDQLYALLMGGGVVGSQDAGDAGYVEVMTRSGFTAVECLDDTSSAGTWAGRALDQDGVEVTWYQENRHPHYGFRYSVRQMSWEDSTGA